MKTFGQEQIEMWCDADRRGKLLRERPEAEVFCPTIKEAFEVQAKEVR